MSDILSHLKKEYKRVTGWVLFILGICSILGGFFVPVYFIWGIPSIIIGGLMLKMEASVKVSIVAVLVAGMSLCISIYTVWLAPTFEQLIEEGCILLNNRDYWGAIRRFDKALEIKSNDPNVLRDKGYALINLGINNEDINIIQFSQAKKFITYYFDSYKNERTTANKHYFERALQCFSEAKVFRPEDLEVLFYYATLGFYLPTGPDPIECFSEIVDIIDKFPRQKQETYPVMFIKHCAWHGKGMAYREHGQKEKAEQCFKRAEEYLSPITR